MCLILGVGSPRRTAKRGVEVLAALAGCRISYPRLKSGTHSSGSCVAPRKPAALASRARFPPLLPLAEEPPCAWRCTPPRTRGNPPARGAARGAAPGFPEGSAGSSRPPSGRSSPLRAPSCSIGLDPAPRSPGRRRTPSRLRSSRGWGRRAADRCRSPLPEAQRPRRPLRAGAAPEGAGRRGRGSARLSYEYRATPRLARRFLAGTRVPGWAPGCC